MPTGTYRVFVEIDDGDASGTYRGPDVVVATKTIRVKHTDSARKAGTGTYRRSCTRVSWLGTCQGMYSPFLGKLLVTSWGERVTLTYKLSLDRRVKTWNASVSHGAGLWPCRNWSVAKSRVGGWITVKASMGGVSASQCWVNNATTSGSWVTTRI